MRLNLLIALLLALVTGAVFSGALRAEFLFWDDEINILDNPHVQGLDADRLRWMFTDTKEAMRYKPLSWLTWACIHAGFGLKPFGYHLANLVWHCLNVVLVFLLIKKLLTPPNGQSAAPANLKLPDAFPEQGKADSVSGNQTRLLVCSALGALLWAIHPLRVEPVVWVTGLPYGQSLFFLFVSLLCYLQANDRPATDRQRTPCYWASVATFGLSLLSYPIGLGYAAILVILDSYRWRRFAGLANGWTLSAWRACLQKAPFLVLTGLFLTVALYARTDGRGDWDQPADLAQFGSFERVMQAFYVWAYYLWKFWAPLHLSPLYTTLITVEPLRSQFLFSAALIVGVSAFVALKGRRWRGIWALWLSHLVVLVPVLGLTEYPHYVCDRYCHLAGVVWAVAIAGTLFRIPSRLALRALGVSVALIAAGAMGVLSVRQTGVWRDSRTLFNYMLAELGEHSSAWDIHCRIAVLDFQQGKTDEAIGHFSKALQMNPGSARTHALLASALERKGDLEAAFAEYDFAKRLVRDPTLYIKSAQVLARQGKTAEAIAEYRAALRLKPNLDEALNHLAWILATHPTKSLRDGAEAVRLAERACELTGYRKATFVGTLAAAYAEAGRFSDAVRTAQRARDLAVAAGQSELAATTSRMLDIYKAGSPFREGGR